MKIERLLLAMLVAVWLAGCGSHEGEDIGLPDPSAGRRNAEDLKTAEEVAEEARGDVDCPADVEAPPRAEGAPVDDVVGVRPGLTFDEAKNVVLCSDELLVANESVPGFDMNTHGQTIRQGFSARFAEAEKSSEQIMQEMQEGFSARSGNAVVQDMEPGQSRWMVTTMGMPGAERVIAAARRESFAAGKNPTMASIEQALIQKYGTPSRNQQTSQRIIAWIYDPRGRLATETSPLYNSCTASSSPDGGANFSPDCGLVVGAQIVPLPENPDLAQYFEVGVVDAAGGYQALTATEQSLQALEAQRRAEEVQKASENADAPKL